MKPGEYEVGYHARMTETALLAAAVSGNLPTTYEEAMQLEDKEEWMAAM